jgi:hypothetical protein
MALTSDEITWINGTIREAAKQAAAQFRANMVVQVATLGLLIDAGITTPEAAIERIEETRRQFAQVFESDDVGKYIAWAVDMLRGDVPLHGSMIEQIIQKGERIKRPA